MHQGSFLLAGGGATTPAMVRMLAALAGGVIVVLPHTQADVERAGQQSVELLQRDGLAQVRCVSTTTPEQIVEALGAARGVWIPGGDQNRFMQRIGAHPRVRQALREVLLRGGVVGGTSAGASLMGVRMPAGEEQEGALRPGVVATTRGLGLLPRAIVDQHLLVRRRLQRLVAAVLQHPELVGIGLDEDAWAVVTRGRLVVYGGQVAVVRVTAPPRLREGVFVVDDLRLRLLAAGDEQSL